MKKSFVLHYDSLDVLEAMTDEQCGKLLKKMRSYHNGNDYISGDQLVDVVFIPLKNQFDRDNEKRQQEKEKRVEAGRLGGKATQSKLKRDQANQASAGNAKANQAVNVNVSGSVNVSENVSGSVNENVIITSSKEETPNGVTITNENCIELMEEAKYALKHGDKDVNKVIEVMKQSCNDAGLQYMSGYKEREFAKHILSKKLANEIEKYNMPLFEFIENIIRLSAQPYTKQCNTPQLFYQNWGHVINSGTNALKAQKENGKPIYVFTPM